MDSTLSSAAIDLSCSSDTIAAKPWGGQVSQREQSTQEVQARTLSKEYSLVTSPPVRVREKGWGCVWSSQHSHQRP